MTKEIYEYLKREGFRRRVLDDKSGFWYEKLYKTFFGTIEVVVDESGVWCRPYENPLTAGRTKINTPDKLQNLLEAINKIPKKL